MGIVQHRINGRAIYEAVKVNGASHIREDWFQFDADGKPIAGCALGLAAINLKVKAQVSDNLGANLYDQLRQLPVDNNSRWYTDVNAVSTTDSYGNVIPANNVADTIIYWNDAMEYDYETVTDPYHGQYKREIRRYKLETWEEVHQMVHDVLEPYFAREFVVDVWEWDAPNFNAQENYFTAPEPEYAAY